jgi:enoyl-CoA hydratase
MSESAPSPVEKKLGEGAVSLRLEGPVAFLTIDRQAQRNALSPQVFDGLFAALNEIEDTSATRVAVLTGAGTKVFCAGGDLSSMSQDGFLEGHEGRRRYAHLLLRLQQLRKPTLARVNGHALAGGLGLVLACDIAVITRDAQLGTPEIDRGLFPMMVTALLQRHLGRKRSLGLLLSGQRISAEEALQWGLVNEAASAADFDARVGHWCQVLAAKSLAVLRLGRRAFYAAEDMPLEAALEFLSSQFSLNVTAEDAAEGVAAFLDKRSPRWNDR